MNTKHTPGPWEILPNGDIASKVHEFVDFGGKTGTKKVFPILATVKEFASQKDYARANARLIASAPELLEALNALVAWMDASELSKTKPGGVGAFRYEGHEYSVVTQARAAIRKAKGEA